MMDDLRSILASVCIGVGVYLFATHNVADAIYFEVMSLVVEPRRG